MNIAICDDSHGDIEFLKEQIKYVSRDSDRIVFYEFSDGRELLEDYKSYDMIFLDIQMEGKMDGRQTAEQIRKMDSDALLSFYTAYDFPASDIVKVRPFSYLVKDRNPEKIREELETLMEEARRRQKDIDVPILFHGNSCVIPSREILYIDIFDKGCGIYLTEKGVDRVCRIQSTLGQDIQGNMVKSSKRLGEYYELLKEEGFAYAKKSYIVNLYHLIFNSKEYITIRGDTILNVARSKQKEFQEALGKFWGEYPGGKQ